MNRVEDSAGSTLVELMVAIVILGMIGAGFFGLFSALLGSSVLAQQKAAALTMVTNRMEYLKSLPYNNLAVAGGSIYSATPLPATETVKQNNVTYTITTSINYVDDAFDGCTNYPSQALKQKYCRNYPAPSGAPTVDQNPQDYKVINVYAKNRQGTRLAEVDTQIAARVAETASNTGSLFVNVIDSTGNPVQGASVSVNNPTLAPTVAVSDTTDSAGIAIFYGLPPDTTGFDYSITASKTGYSTLATIGPSGTLQPNYPKQNIFAQQSSYVTLPISPQAQNSLAIETTTTNGAPLGNVKVYVKGGYKKYTATTDTSYYYDALNPSDTRPTTDASGFTALTNLTPGGYYFCGDSGATSCQIGGTTYYLAAAVPYGGSNILSPITVPADSASPGVTFPYGGNNYIQQVRLMLTTSSTHPRVTSITPAELSLSSGTASAFAFTVNGTNLPCSASAGACSTNVSLSDGAQTFTASCTGSSAGTNLDCTANMSGVALGRTSMNITANGQTLTLPGGALLGGINVAP